MGHNKGEKRRKNQKSGEAGKENKKTQQIIKKDHRHPRA